MTNAAKSIISPPIAHPEVRAFAEAKVNLPQDAVQARRDKINDLRDRLARWMKDHPDCGIAKSYHSGSLAKGTALRVSSDADLALYIRHDGPRRANRELSEWIAERLRKAYPQMAPEQIQPEEFSVKIIFKTAGIDVDVVPVFYEDDPDNKGWLVSKADGGLMLTSIPMHLAFIRKRKNANPKHFAQVARLGKWWAAQQKAADPNFRFKSFMIELILAHLVDKGTSLSDYAAALRAFFNYIVTTGLEERIAFTDYYPLSALPKGVEDPIQIFDPVNPDNNVASRYTVTERRAIVDAAQDALDALNEAYMASTKSHAVEMWQVVLGPSFRGAK